MRYTKLPITIDDQIKILKDRGLIITNEKFAHSQLNKISYFRLANYWRPMEEDKVLHCFKPHSTFENAIRLYQFDLDLRSIIFTGIQTIEIALRSKIIQNVSLEYGAFWFAEESLFVSSAIYRKCLDSLTDEISRSKEDFLEEHFAKYHIPSFPPAWKALEVASFGTIAKLYANLKNVKLKKRIAKEFGLPQHLFLESWIKSIAALRNCVAHHARVWNRKYPIKPQLPLTLPNQWISTEGVQPERLYSILCTIQYLLKALDEGEGFNRKMAQLLYEYPNVDITSMGFPKDWVKEPLWK